MTTFAFVVWTVSLVITPPALACVPGSNATNTHTTSGIFNGWTRTWSCDHWVYQAITSHNHGQKIAGMSNSDTGAVLCSKIGSATSVTCSISSTSTHRDSFNDTGAIDPCALFGDGHGICFHVHERIP